MASHFDAADGLPAGAGDTSSNTCRKRSFEYLAELHVLLQQGILEYLHRQGSIRLCLSSHTHCPTLTCLAELYHL
jgi:hypothetical protein